MLSETTIFRIPKDPRSNKIIFLTGMPYVLKGRIDDEEWIKTIDDLNSIIANRESPSFTNFVNILLIIPVIFDSLGFEKDVQKYLMKVNRKLESKGIYIRDPSMNSFTELEVVITEELS